jgi:Mg2+-importing ATPase
MYTGLSKTEVIKLKLKHGKNELPKPQYRFLKLLFRQFKSIFILILVLAAGVTYFLGETFDSVFILLFVLLGVGLSLFQEYKSNAAANKLQSYLVRTITVRRNNRDEEVVVSELVPGDIIKLEPGDIVPADAKVLHIQGFQVDETTFTGESLPVVKVAYEEGGREDASSLLQGTIVVRGLCFAEVIKTGIHTRLAKIAEQTTTIESKSELTKGIDRISNFILRVTLITLLFVILGNVLIEGDAADIPSLLIFAIALAVSVIPEALPLVMTFSLSRGALRLAKNHVIVKRLSAVQDLGSIELLCTDKTGTITENKLVYKNDYVIENCSWHPLVLSILTSNNLDERNPEPFDLATKAALNPEQLEHLSMYELLEEEPFDPALRSNGAILKSQDGISLHIRRGSPEYFIEQGLVGRDLVGSWLEDEEKQGRRVLGVSYDTGSGAQFGGFISFADTLKPSTAKTLEQAKELNVAVTIITGDSLMVAEAIGREVALVTSKEEVIETSVFFALPVEEQYKRLESIRVFARTTPEQKLSLITLLKERYTVGFLGEGINDAAALKAANVSLVVNSASDVARETADIVLLKSNLQVIIDGIRLGRETHANTLKYIRATLVSNFGNFYAIAVASLFITFLPMLPKQLLLLNLLSDFPMMAIAFDRVNKSEITRPQKYDFRSLYIIFITLGLVSTIFDFMWFGLFFKEGAGILQTNWFIASVITEIILLLSIRSMLPIEKAGLPAPIILWLSGFAIISTVAITMIPFTANYFEFVTPTMGHLGLILGLAVVYLIVTEAVKRPVAKFLKIP